MISVGAVIYIYHSTVQSDGVAINAAHKNGAITFDLDSSVYRNPQ